MRYWNGRIDRFGYTFGFEIPHDVDIESMMIPVRCLRCHHGVYDMTRVEVVDRHFINCTVWKAPCCGAIVDDQSEYGLSGSSQRHYEKIQVDQRTTRREATDGEW